MASLAKRANVSLSQLYRAVLRAAKPFDQQPHLRAALTPRLTGPTLQHVPLIAVPSSVKAGPLRDDAEEVEEVVNQVITSFAWHLYRPGAASAGSSFRDHVAKAFRYNMTKESVGLDAAVSGTRLLKLIAASLQGTPGSVDELTGDVGTLVGGEALTPGCLMVEHPSILNPGHTVALVYDISKNVQDIHGNEDWMVRSYVINRPLYDTVGSFFKRDDLGEFGALQLFHGGRDSNNLAVIHRLPNIEGAAAIDESDTLFIGGSIKAINDALTNDKASPDDFKVVLGSLDIKLAGGDDNLELPEDDRYILVGGDGVKDVTLLPPQTSQTQSGEPAHLFFHQDQVWRKCMLDYSKTTGGDEATFAGMTDMALGPLQALAQKLPMDIILPFSEFKASESAK